MRVRMLEDVAAALGTYHAGSTCDIPDAIGNSWCSAGLAMMDKSLDSASETKKDSLYWCKKCGCSHKADSEIGKKHRGGR